MRERFTVYITKYALTTGIEKIEAEDCFDTSPGMIGDTARSCVYYHGDEWHRDLISAMTRAAAMKEARINSLKNQIAKLEKLTIRVPA